MHLPLLNTMCHLAEPHAFSHEVSTFIYIDVELLFPLSYVCVCFSPKKKKKNFRYKLIEKYNAL